KRFLRCAQRLPDPVDGHRHGSALGRPSKVCDKAVTRLDPGRLGSPTTRSRDSDRFQRVSGSRSGPTGDIADCARATLGGRPACVEAALPTRAMTCAVPAWAKVKVTGTTCPSLSGSVRPSSIK